MKTFTILPIALFLASSLNAQTTALDFTANDCDGMSHNLFSELEAGNAVIIELVMMGCQPCVDAGNSIKTNVIPNTSDPSRVKFYSIGFTNSITCTQMNNWKTTNGFTHTVFAGMSAQTTHYGGMGMPTIAIIGGPDHAVFYAEQGHSASDNPTIIAAIDEALNAGVGLNERSMTQITVSPNPAHEIITVSGGAWTTAAVLDTQGREVFVDALRGGRLDIGELPAGVYLMRLTDNNGGIGNARFEKR
ncbi:MAG TPA: T9SS type A sorting domain-containing protein [Flavobacteriales bacterium]|nr:T9SS type A sorting domain-containing protein [Flavobacteriales bacterium]